MSSRHHILIVYGLRSSFVKQDIDALKVRYSVIEYEFGIKKGVKHVFAQLNFMFFLIKNASKFTAVYSWFADYHSFFPAVLSRIFKFKFILAIGGFDAAKLDEFHYGVHIKLLRSKIVKFAIQRSDLIIFSSLYTLNELVKNTHLKIQESRYKIVYPGINPQIISAENKHAKYLMIYVAAGDSINRMKIKGVDRFIDLARLMSQFQFLLIGPTGNASNWVLESKSNNLTTLPNVDRDQLFQYYKDSEFIALFSRFEAFGMVLLEGISAGCKPITLSNLGAEEIVSQCGTFGKVFNSFDAQEISDYLKLNFKKEFYSSDVQSCLQKFPEDKRAEIISNFLGPI